jgi:hypothetical protein
MPSFLFMLSEMKLKLYNLPDDLVHVSRFIGEDTGILKYDAVAQGNVMFCHG